MTVKRGNISMLVVLAVLLGFASISTDLFLPALPTMQPQLDAKEGALHFVISAYLLGFAFGQLGWGPVSDRYGRRGPIAVGVLVFILGSVAAGLVTFAAVITLPESLPAERRRSRSQQNAFVGSS